MTVLLLLAAYFLSLIFFACMLKEKKAFFIHLDRYMLAGALVLHTYIIITRGIEGHRFPLTDMFETLLAFAWLVVVIGMYLYSRYDYAAVRTISGVAAFFIILFSTFIAYEVQPLMPSLRSGWLYVHVGAYFIAYASFVIGFGVGVIYLVVSLMEKTEQRRQDLLDNLEGMIFRIIDIGFPFLTVGLSCGAIWASISWGRFWSWDPKEVWALVTWLIYAGCLHLRHARNLRGVYAAVMATVGFIVIVFTYVGVNMFFSTVHSYA